MALLSKQEFADKCGIKTKELAVYLKRRKVIQNDNEMYNDAEALNIAFMKKMQERKGTQTTTTTTTTVEEIPTVETETVITLKAIKGGKKNTPKPPANENEDNEDGGIYDLDKKKLKLDIEKKAADLESVLLKNARAKGEVIPFGLMLPIITQNNQSITTAYKNAADAWIIEIAKKHDLGAEYTAEIKKSLTETINNAVKTATENSLNSVAIIVEDYKSTLK